MSRLCEDIGFRFYVEPLMDAAQIAAEVQADGESSWWAGPTEKRDMVADLLRPLRIVCVDAKRGTWRKRS